MAFNYGKLHGRIIEKYGSQQDFSRSSNISQARISGVLNNKIELKPREIIYWCECLGIDKLDIPSYFFAN